MTVGLLRMMMMMTWWKSNNTDWGVSLEEQGEG